MADGTITRIRGSVVDACFDAGLPRLRNLLTGIDGERVRLEVVEHLSASAVRAIALTPTQGLARGTIVRGTGAQVQIPVGRAMLGRMVDVFGAPIDLFHTGIKVVDLLAPLERGGKAQLPAFRSVTGPMRLAYAQFEELEVFARFGTRLDRRTKQTLDHGARVREIIKQAETAPLTPFEQIVVLLPAVAGVFDGTPTERILPLAERLRQGAQAELGEIAARIAGRQPLGQADQDAIVEYARRVLEQSHGAGTDADA